MLTTTDHEHRICTHAAALTAGLDGAPTVGEVEAAVVNAALDPADLTARYGRTGPRGGEDR